MSAGGFAAVNRDAAALALKRAGARRIALTLGRVVALVRRVAAEIVCELESLILSPDLCSTVAERVELAGALAGELVELSALLEALELDSVERGEVDLASAMAGALDVCSAVSAILAEASALDAIAALGSELAGEVEAASSAVGAVELASAASGSSERESAIEK